MQATCMGTLVQNIAHQHHIPLVSDCPEVLRIMQGLQDLRVRGGSMGVHARCMACEACRMRGAWRPLEPDL